MYQVNYVNNLRTDNLSLISFWIISALCSQILKKLDIKTELVFYVYLVQKKKVLYLYDFIIKVLYLMLTVCIVTNLFEKLVFFELIYQYLKGFYC
jgi:hypothetical protein